MSEEEENLDYDPWEAERDAYLAEGHEDVEVEWETLVPADTGSTPDLEGGDE